MTRAEERAAWWRAAAAIAAVAAITAVADVDALHVGVAAAGLLYLLPVLWASARAGLPFGLATAGAAAVCYNFFLLEPRYSLRIGGVADIAAFAVLTIAALVTSRLASDLRQRELESRDRASASLAEIELIQALARMGDREALDCAALAFFARRFGDAFLVDAGALAAHASGLAPLDAAAAAWALHNGGVSGRASDVMPAADHRFVPLGPGSADVLALAAAGHDDHAAGELAVALARLWVQARDRLTAADERQAREAAEAREDVRRTLLAALGHDFRTPLTILKSGLGEIGNEPAGRLGREVDRLIRLSDDLVAAARLESGALAALEPVDLVDVLASAIPTSEINATARIEVALPADLPLVQADPVMLVHLVGNLLDNAVRHARSLVTVTARPEGAHVRLDVADDGEGIDPAIAATLFDRLVTGSDRQSGSGLGLAIARDLAIAMGAELSAGVAPGGGACFTLFLRGGIAPVAEPA